MYRPPLRQESAEIRQRMLHVRSRMPWSMDRARAEAQRLTSWKFYVRRYPWVVAGALAGIAYVLVPKRRSRVIVERSAESPPQSRRGEFGSRWLHALRNRNRDQSSETSEVVAKSSLVGVVTSFLFSSAIKMATAYAGNQVRSYFASRVAVPPTVPPTQRTSPHKASQPEQTHDR